MKKILKRRILDTNRVELDPSFHPLLQRIYRLRGVSSADELDLCVHSLARFETLSGISEAVTILYEVITNQLPILIVGDFDVDGATSTALVIKALRSFKVVNVDYFVPDRLVDGYGLSPNVIEQAVKKKSYLIITVDNGISSIEGVALAKKYAIKVIITDHHLPPKILPEADAIINPNLSNCGFPSKNLAGVGVAFYFMLALRAYLRQQNWFTKHNIAELNMSKLLDLVALGTIADVVILDKNNRILVHHGLCRIRNGLASVGVNALIKISNKKRGQLSSSDLGYLLAPRLNAAGRMKNMAIGIELLLCENESQAKKIAEELELLNNQRRSIEQMMQIDAMAYVKEIKSSLTKLPKAIVIFHPDWHQGIIGILSARIKDYYHRPVISFAAADNGTLKGSGRSIKGFHLRDALVKIDVLNPGLIASFGGHAMAVGLMLNEANLQKFKQCFLQVANEMIDDEMLNHVVLSDGPLMPQWFDCDIAYLIKMAGPWGAGFPEPLFDDDFYFCQQQIVGEKHLKLIVRCCSGGPLLEGIAFNTAQLTCCVNQPIERIKLVYHLDVNEFNGRRKLQLLVRHLWVIR